MYNILLKLTENAISHDPLFEKCFQESWQAVAQLTSELSIAFVQVYLQQSFELLKHVRNIPSLYRRTNKEVILSPVVK